MRFRKMKKELNTSNILFVIKKKGCRNCSVFLTSKIAGEELSVLERE